MANQMFQKIPIINAPVTKTAAFDTKATKVNVGDYSEFVLCLNVTAASGSLVVNVVMEDPITSGVWHTIETLTAITTISTVNKKLSGFGANIALDCTMGVGDSFTLTAGGIAKP